MSGYHPPHPNFVATPIFLSTSSSVNISNFKYFCGRHLYTLWRSLSCMVKFWAPLILEVDGLPKFRQILTVLGIFHPLLVKISIIATLRFLFYFIMAFICLFQNFRIPRKNICPLLGVAPRDPESHSQGLWKRPLIPCRYPR